METTAIMTSEYQPKIWKRYVDDTFVIWPHGRDYLNTFLDHINALHPSITFTVEVEEGKLPFLDVLILCNNNNNTLETKVYHKPTHTNQYLNFRSHHHPRIELGIVKCLSERARNICSTKYLEDELKQLEDVFGANDYPHKKVKELLGLKKCTKNIKQEEETDNLEGKELLMVLPYI